jgi:L-lactate dehydrogenase complex protein LldG
MLDATVTGCLAAVAATGSIVTGGAAGRGGALVAPLHVCVVERRRFVDGLADLMRIVARLGGGSMIALQTGPSRTADIEKTLIIGVHGPKRVHVVLLDGILDN